MIKVLIRRAQITDNAVRQLSRHDPPRKFTHMMLSGANGKQFAEHIDYVSPGIFVYGLMGWDGWRLLLDCGCYIVMSDGNYEIGQAAVCDKCGETTIAAKKRLVPDLAKGVEGGPLHQYMGRYTSHEQDVEAFEGVSVIELYIAGHVERYANGRRTDGVPFLGLQLDDSTFLDAIDPAFVVYRSDEDDWADVPELYKNADGSPRVDTDAKKDTALISPPPEPE